MKYRILLLIVLFAASRFSFAQTDSMPRKIYKVKVKYELPAGILGLAASTIGYKKLATVSNMSAADVAKLNPNDINSFDRPIAFKDPSKFHSADKTADFFLNFSIVSPIVLALDKKIRHDWLDLITLYTVTHTFDNALYFIGTFSVRRPRPLTYNPKVPIEQKTGDGKSNSFFSGHVGFSSAATFYAVKVYTDYHQIKGWKRIFFYSVAAIPPALVGYYRMQGGRHFKTDVLVGFLAGGSAGILVPELHRIKKKHENISFAPYFTPGGTGGLTFAMAF
ncbi:phosphatase PAP2 family protein [Deminuibacter soli]|uniref:PAP2 family protein n=1 Tax=Deminuibacter soli TaxID=2291815 RepID=A0A3E1NL96_9BACT|nr:phosphatase PAP2 family protein [Deminuibacter soli]RFM28709.1 PAP2 family protein [Deminuibacter soli]